MNPVVARLALALGLGLGLFACSSSSGVGNSCAQDTDCGGALTCIKQTSGGYCIQRPCSGAGISGGCPDDSICANVSILGGDLACLKKCSQQSDCRTGAECNGVSSTNVKACQPKQG